MTQPSQYNAVPESEGEAYFVEQALAYYREMKTIAKNAPYGEFLNATEAVALLQGRKLIQTSLQTIAQEEIHDLEKKKETRLCPKCQMKKRHRGNPKKDIETAVGTLTLKRRYDECIRCQLLEHAADEPLGLKHRYTVGLRRLAVRAGGVKSFVEAKDDLQEYCGLDLSHMTIRELCHQEAPKMEQWCQKSSEIQKDFIEAPGVVEVTMDAAKVNTTGGWRDVKVGIVSKRELGKSALPQEWDKRHLPRPGACVAFAAIEEKGFFQQRLHDWRVRLQLGAREDISALGDGAEWIWNIIRTVFGDVRENLDVYHGLEHLSDVGKVLYGEGTEAYTEWQEATKREFLESGFEEIERRIRRLEGEKWECREREEIRKLRGYLSSQATRLNYRERLLKGRAIGSGQVEGACKNMIGRRLKQTGAKWLVPRLNRMTVLCSVRYSSHWKKYWISAK